MTPISFQKTLFLFLLFVNVFLFVLILKFSTTDEYMNFDFDEYPPQNEIFEYREFLINMKNKYESNPEVSDLCSRMLTDINTIIFTNNYSEEEIRQIRKNFSDLSEKFKNEYSVKQEKVYSY